MGRAGVHRVMGERVFSSRNRFEWAAKNLAVNKDVQVWEGERESEQGAKDGRHAGDEKS